MTCHPGRRSRGNGPGSNLLAVLALFVSLSATAAVDVASQATGGSGSAGDPWTGWDTSIPWAPRTEYLFRSGHFAYSRSPNFLKAGLALVGEAGATLRFRGEGDAVVFDSFAPVADVRMENLIVHGNANTRNGLLVRGARNPTLRHVSVREVASAGVWIEDVIGGLLENVRVTQYEMPDYRFAVVPDYGLVFSSRAGLPTSGVTVVNPVVEGTGKIGIWIQTGADGNTLINGTSEANRGKGIVIDGAFNTVINTDFEQNGSNIDVEITGDGNDLRAVFTDQTVDVRAGQLNKIRGRFHRIRISAACNFTDVSGAFMSGPLEDSSVTTIKYGYGDNTGYHRGRMRWP